VSARAAGLFAQASRLIERFDRARARELRQRAERAWRWAKDHGARDAYALYALGELFRTTGDESYARDFESRWRALGRYGAFSNFALRHNQTGDYVRAGQVMPDYILGYLRADGADPEIRALAERWLTQHADRAAASVLASPHAHRNARPTDLPPDWGQATVMGRHLDPIVARLALGDVDAARQQRYLDALSVAADYVLGANPLGRTFITGLGARPPLEPLHLDSLAHIANGRGPVPGIPVYGPVRELPRADYYTPARDAFHPPFDRHPLMRRYADVRSFVNTNECTVWECQAPHTQHFAILSAL
jgi:endoglucanase